MHKDARAEKKEEEEEEEEEKKKDGEEEEEEEEGEKEKKTGAGAHYDDERDSRELGRNSGSFHTPLLGTEWRDGRGLNLLQRCA